MKVTCRYSGVQFQTQGFGRFSATSHHPLFELPIERLLRDVLPLYLQGRLPEPETRVFYCALLKHSGLVLFEHHAAPSLRTINSTIQALVRTLDWTTTRTTSFKLPSYRVTKDNCALRNIMQWINSWNDAKTTMSVRQSVIEEHDAALLRKDTLHKLINSAYKKTEDYAAKLGRYVVETCGLQEKEAESCITIFKLREPAVFSYDAEPIIKLLAVMEQKLDLVEDLIARKAMQHIKRQAFKNKAGILYELEDLEENEVALVLSREKGTPYIMLTRHERMQQEVAETAPTQEPVESAFPTRVAYLVARAKWNTALSIKAKLEENKREQAQATTTEHSSAVLEDKTLLDPDFDNELSSGDEPSEEDYASSYEDYAQEKVEEALAKMTAGAVEAQPPKGEGFSISILKRSAGKGRFDV